MNNSSHDNTSSTLVNPEHSKERKMRSRNDAYDSFSIIRRTRMTAMMKSKTFHSPYTKRTINNTVVSHLATVSVIFLFVSMSFVPLCHGFTTVFQDSIPQLSVLPSLLGQHHVHLFMTKTKTPLRAVYDDSIGPHPHTIRRSRFFASCGATLASTFTTLILTVPTHPSLAAGILTSNEALQQFNAAVSTTDDILKNWDAIASKGGDAIRTELGTNGGASPLFQINKAVKVLQSDVAEDPVAFAEAAEEFLLGLGRADAMAYSSIFAGGAGKPTPPAVYIAKSKVEVELIRRYEREMLEAIGK